nr:FYDLN acid domain-containing protein [Hyphomicrobium denitrificans]
MASPSGNRRRVSLIPCFSTDTNNPVVRIARTREPHDFTLRGYCVPLIAALEFPASPRGTKHTCTNEICGHRFYDLNQVSPACPYCQTPCDVSTVDRYEFEMAVRPKKGKVYRLEAIPAPSPEDEGVEQDQPVKDDEPFSPPDVLINVEDDDDDTQEVLSLEKGSEEVSSA